MCLAPSVFMNASVLERRNFGSRDSMTMKNRSSVARRKRMLLKSGCESRGKPFIKNINPTADSADKRMVSSKMIGIHAGTDMSGLPEIRNGYPVTHTNAQMEKLAALVKACKQKPTMVPVIPAPKTSRGRIVRLIPIALSRPCTGNGT